MLVLTRLVGEKVRIGSNTTVTILKVDGDSVSVGIDAPKEVLILRSELDERNPQSERSKE